ncbi:membrane complex biogenesis protein, BtpA family [Pseudomonas aeruginosa]|nr:BtpA/SgcQ family protein [Pseudomonas aeruginosa]CRN66901.1 membrane complex biogenesis protein, BtpA family [Pseudomonas aeruginosa]
MGNRTQVLPVIHFLDRATAMEQAELAFDAGADGVFLISHGNEDAQLGGIAQLIKAKHAGKRVGINLLTHGPRVAAQVAVERGLDMIWGDDCGVSSAGFAPLANDLSAFIKAYSDVQVFASVAFKYQAVESLPADAARNALDAGFVPTTSGEATGSPPSVEKIALMSSAANGKLAVASGMTVDNVQSYARYLSHILVATGVSVDEHHFDYEVLHRFVALARLAR